MLQLTKCLLCTHVRNARILQKDDELHHRLRLGGLLYGDCSWAAL